MMSLAYAHGCLLQQAIPSCAIACHAIDIQVVRAMSALPQASWRTKPQQPVLAQEGPAQSTNSTSSDSNALRGLLEGVLQQQQHVAMQTPVKEALSPAREAHMQCSTGPLETASSSVVRMESQLIFDSCWRRFKEKHGLDFSAPREIIWLNGAPGSGKGVSTPHILKARGMTRSVCVSSLLSSAAEARKYIESGEMIADHVVGELLLEAVLLPASSCLSTADLNLVVDGFPRTAVQVDFVKLLMEQLNYLHTKYADTPHTSQFPRPSFKVVVLYVDEGTSISRQLQRAVSAQAHNKRAKDAGVGDHQLQEERSTDVRPDKAAKRYQIFRQHYSAIMRLKQFFPFHLIDAMGSLADTKEQITKELRYQSSLDLSEEVYTQIRHLPLAKDLQKTARQQLVSRLEAYCRQQRPLFGRVLGLLQQEVLPLLQQGALGGCAEWVSQEQLFSQHPGCVDMLLDVLTDRGFHATYVKELLAVPSIFNPSTGVITTHLQPVHRFKLSFEAPGVRDATALKGFEIAARLAEAAAGGSSPSGSRQQGLLQAGAPITETVIPQHLDLEAKIRAQDLKRVQLASGSTGSSCSHSSSCTGSCSSSSSSVDGNADQEDVYTIYRCLRPDMKCGHAQELEVLSASG